MAKRELLIIGIDGAVPDFIKKFSKKGMLPNIASLIDDGVLAEAYPCVPCDTPTNWTTLATGATTATHGVTSFLIHVPGEPLDLGVSLRGRSSLSYFCKAEYFWDVAERFGFTPFIINYPVGWPGNLKRGAMSLFSWPIPESLPMIISPERIYVISNVLIGEEKELPPDVRTYSPPLKGKIVINGGLIREAKQLEIIVLDSTGNGYDSILLFVEENKKDFQILRKSSWSSWIELPIETTCGLLKGLFKVKLLNLTSDGKKLEIYRTRIFNKEGWTNPPTLGEKFIKNVLFKHELSFHVDEKRIPYDIYGVEKEYVLRNMREASCLAKMIKYAKETLGWNICYLHYHLLDGINHRFAAIYEGLTGHSSDEEERAREAVEFAYRIVDDFVGELIRTCVNENTIVVLVSDHGAVPTWKTVNLCLAFVNEGLLSYKWDSKLNKYVVDWNRTLAFPYYEPPYVWVNLKGREPHGIVDSKDYEDVREQIIDCLYSIKDNGRHVVSLALKKEDATILSQGGDRVGDVIYLLNPPYQIWDMRMEILNTAEMLPEIVSEGLIHNSHRVFGAHVYYLPTAKLGSFSVSSILIMKGPEINGGLELKKPINLIDVVPTLANLLNIPPPKNCEGKVIAEFLLD